ncbi:MAG: ATP-binding cassette domain-containing protein [Opitutae bacterium]|nr:ATP-binding cassette domain-containing protein [Opitutae bacterium]
MVLLGAQNLCLAYGGPKLLNHASFEIRSGDRVCLLGRNGSGKSSLFRILLGKEKPDTGQFEYAINLNVKGLPQEVPTDIHGSCFEIIAQGFGTIGKTLARFKRLSNQMLIEENSTTVDSLAEIQEQIESAEAWGLIPKIEQVASRLRIEADANFSTLSAGLKRRVLLGKALVSEPDLLLLDEPTNHLDIPAILWLEEFIQTFKGAILFVTHDRAFLQKLATRILDLERGTLTNFNCDYQTFLKRKKELLEAETKKNANFDKKLSQEEVWIRKGIQARRTRNEGRVRALKKMRNERKGRQDSIGGVQMEVSNAEISGQKVIIAKEVQHTLGGKTLIDKFSLKIMRGNRIGMAGPNGCGKTTLIQILLGLLQPDKGSVELGTKLEIAYFDQLRKTLKENESVQFNVNDGNEFIELGGRRTHVNGYLQDFLFPPHRVRSPVSSLSGGEKNRLILAKLFAKPSNCLVLDEPTNDLDAETLELLEERLLDFKGTVILVSHDRAFLENIVTSTLVFQNNNQIVEHWTDCNTWIPYILSPKSKPKTGSTIPKKAENKPRKLSFKEDKELKAIPQQIENLETEQSNIIQGMADPTFFQNDAKGDKVRNAKQRLESIEWELENTFKRWEELETIEREFLNSKQKARG